MPRFAVVIPASCTPAFLSQIAAFHRALFSISWTRWEPALHVIFGGPIDTQALDQWRPHLDRAAITFVSPRDFADKGIWAQADAELTAAPRDADVVIAMDADTLIVRNIEPLLDRVLAERAIAGCIAHHRTPGWEAQSERACWAALALGLTEVPLDFVHRYALSPDAENAPFYLNFGAIYFESSALQRILQHFAAFRSALAARMDKPVFSAQVALTLAATEAGVTQIVLPNRFNFPNDPKAGLLYPEDLREAAVFHYLRTSDFDRAEIFGSAGAYTDFMTQKLTGVNLAFREAVRRVLGSSYPFGLSSLPLEPPLAGLPAAVRQRIAALDVEIQASPAEQAAIMRLMRDVLATGLFDEAFYLENAPRLKDAGGDALWHYVTVGEAERRRPNRWFDPAHYRRLSAEAKQAPLALLHYAREGEAEGFEASADFSGREYRAANPGNARLAAAPLRHWLAEGEAQGLPHRLPGSKSFRHWRDVHVRALSELMEFRKALVAEYGVERGFDAYRIMLDLPNSARLVRRTLTAQLEAARQDGAPFRLVTPAGMPFQIPAAEVIGPGEILPITGKGRSLYLACLAKAKLRGASSLVVHGEAALLDAEGAEFTCMDVDYAFDAAVFHADAGTVWMIEDDRANSPAINEAFCLLGARSIAFGHWMWEQLPKYAQARLAGLSPTVPILIENGLPKSHRQSLEMLYPGVQLIEVAPFETFEVARLWVAPTLHFAPLFERRTEKFAWSHWAAPATHAVAPLADLGGRAERLAADVAQDRRIYLARRPGTHRMLLNHKTIEALLAARGYEIVYPEDLSFVEQVRMIRSARFVAAADGSAAFLMLLARAGTRLCLLSSSETSQHSFFTGLLLANRTDMVIVSGPIMVPHPDWPEWADYEIDPATLAAVLQRLETPATAQFPPQELGAGAA